MSSRVAQSSSSHVRTAISPSSPPKAIDATDPLDDSGGDNVTDTDIEAVSATLGESSDGEVRALIGDVSDADLVASGHGVATPRISKEATRVANFATAFFATATPAAQASLCMSPKVVRVMAWCASQGNRAWRRLSAQRAQHKTTRAVRSDTHDATAARARGERDQLADALGKVVVGSPALEARIDAAMKPAAQGEPDPGPGKSLETLVGIGREQLASTTRDVVTRCEMWGATASRLDAAAKLATKAIKASRAAKAVAIDFDHEQSIVDRWDGINLILIDQIVRAFAKARAAGQAVPPFRLVYLRGVLGTHKSKGAPAKPVTPVTPVAPVAQHDASSTPR